MKRTVKKIAVIAAILLLLVGCSKNNKQGNSSEKTNATKTEKNSDTLEKITFYGVKDPQISLTQILADQLGYFEEEGLQLENTYLPTVQDLAPLMVNGQAGIACATNYGSAIWSMNGAKIKIVAPTTNIGGTQCVLLNSKISISNAKELEGLNVGVLAGSTQHLTFIRMCKDLGLNIDAFNIVPLQFPDQLSALSNGQVDMIATTEPWITKTKAIMDVTKLCSGIESYIPGFEKEVNWCNTYSCIIVQDDWVKEHADILPGILRAMNKATDYINEHRDDAIKILSEQLELKEEEMRSMMEGNVYGFGVDDLYVSTTSELLDFTKAEGMNQNGSDLKMSDYHDFSYLKEALPDKYTATVEFE